MHARHKQAAIAARPPKLRSDYFTESELAGELGVSARTLWVWRHEGKGPPVTMLGRVPLYRIEAVKDWLKASEKLMPRERSARRTRTAGADRPLDAA
jgi:hypothetical protein